MWTEVGGSVFIRKFVSTCKYTWRFTHKTNRDLHRRQNLKSEHSLRDKSNNVSSWDKFIFPSESKTEHGVLPVASVIKSYCRKARGAVDKYIQPGT